MTDKYIHKIIIWIHPCISSKANMISSIEHLLRKKDLGAKKDDNTQSRYKYNDKDKVMQQLSRR